MKEVTKAYQKKAPNQIVPASYLVLRDKGKVLLAERKNSWFYDEHYGLVSWHVEKNENFTDAIIREAKEEIGITIDRDALSIAHILQRMSDKNKSQYNQRIDAFFLADSRHGTIENKEPEKCADLARYPLNDLPDNIIPYIKTVLNNIANNEFYSEDGRG